MSQVPTKHNNAKENEVAENVIMTGDPIRCKFIAEKYLSDFKIVNNVRGAVCYTGKYKGKEVSIMASGMGAGSMGIYSYELYAFYNVKQIVRIGTCGIKNDKYKIGDVLLSNKIITDTNYRNHAVENINEELSGSKQLVDKAKKIAKIVGLDIVEGKTFSTDTFYDNHSPYQDVCDNVEMEGGALYLNAKMFKRKAICICVITDIIGTNNALNSMQRENYFDNVIKISLEMSV